MTVRNASDQAEIDRGKTRIRRDDAIRNTVLQALMSTPDGRRYVWLELEYAKVFSGSEAMISDHASLAFSEGLRRVGLRLFNEVVNGFPVQFTQMLTEARREQNGGRNSSDPGDSGDSDEPDA